VLVELERRVFSTTGTSATAGFAGATVAEDEATTMFEAGERDRNWRVGAISMIDWR